MKTRRPRQPPRFRGQSLNRLLPNILTILALCAGLSAIRFAIQGRWEAAVIAILIAAVFDGMDGWVARLLKAQSNFGAQLDSLSDFISFGVAPATVLYLWVMRDADRFGWIAVLAFSVCSALRLARFNTQLEEHNLPPWAYNYFTGVPMPAAAGLAVMPMTLSFLSDDLVRSPIPVAVWIIGVALLMVSRLKTFSLKGVRIPNRYIVVVLVGVGLVAASLVSQTWLTLTLLGLTYLASIPLSMRRFHMLERKATELKSQTEPASVPALAPAATPAAPEPDRPKSKSEAKPETGRARRNRSD